MTVGYAPSAWLFGMVVAVTACLWLAFVGFALQAAIILVSRVSRLRQLPA